MSVATDEPVASATAGDPEGPAAPAGRRAWAGLAVLAAALAMIVLDGTVVGVALPTIMAELRLDLTDAQWVNSLYSVVFAALLLTAGRLGDRFGRRRMLLLGLVGFVFGSILAALSVGPGGLLAARALQGVGGALVLPSTLSTVNATFRGRDRAAAFGVWGAAMSGAAALGPLLGGWLTHAAGWHLIFWINVPIGLVVGVGAVLLVDETRSASLRPGFDLMGPLLSAAGLGLVVFGLIEGTSLGWWRAKADLSVLGLTWSQTALVSPAPLAVLVGLAALVAFVGVERRRQRAGLATVLDLGLFGIRTFELGNVTAALVAVGEFALLFVLPLFLITSLGLTTLGAGLVLAAMATGALLSGAAARHLAARVGPSRVVMIGLLLEVLGASVTALVVGADGTAWAVALALVPYGLGLGLASAQLTSTTLRDVPTAQSGSASATQSTMRQLGSALGTAVGGTTLAVVLAARHPGTALAGPQAFAAAASTTLWVAVGALAVALGLASLLERSSRRAPAGRP